MLLQDPMNCICWVFAGVYLVQSRKFKEQLIAAAAAAVHTLLDIVCTAARESNMKLTEEYQVTDSCMKGVCHPSSLHASKHWCCISGCTLDHLHGCCSLSTSPTVQPGPLTILL